MQGSTSFYSILMIIAGLGIPVMATLNTSLGVKLQSISLATVILLVVGLVVVITYLFLIEGIPSKLYVPETPLYFYTAGIFYVFYIVSISWVAPRFGVGNSLAFVLFGQLIAMTIIDHYALFGAYKYAIDFKRLIGLILMGSGVFMVLSKT